MPKSPKATPIPRIEIKESPANDLYLFFSSLIFEGSALARLAMDAVIEEGEKFALEQESRRDTVLMERLFAEIDDFLREKGSEPVVAWELSKKYLSLLLQESGGSLVGLLRRKRVAEEGAEHEGDGKERPLYFVLGLVSLAKRFPDAFAALREFQPGKAGKERRAPAEKREPNRKRGVSLLR
jgi:hypothetical protein